MKKITIICIIIVSLGVLVNSQSSKYNKLVWQDEFEGNSVDRAKWQYEDHCRPQNDELQCYTPRTSNVYVQNGKLHVKAIPENYGGRKYTSGRINTKHSAAWKYGRFEVRAKLPKGDYLWPAFWMLPRDYVYGGWAASGEIDIMEYRGQHTNQVSNALHYGGAWPNNAHVGSGAMNFNFDFSEDYHTFTTIWERDQIQWLVDGKVVSTRSLTKSWYSGRGNNPYNDIRQPFDQPFFFLINMAIGGNFFGAQSQSLTTSVAQKWQNPVLMVDWVRVYQEGDNVVPNPVPVPTTVIKTSVKTSQAPPKTSQSSPTVTKVEENNDNPCNGKCGSMDRCCNDQKIGIVCFDSNYSCETDSHSGKKTLCGKGLGACNTVCFNKQMYKCESGSIRLL